MVEFTSGYFETFTQYSGRVIIWDMKKILWVTSVALCIGIAVIVLITPALYAERYITFTDSNGVEHRYKLADNIEVITYRPD